MATKIKDQATAEKAARNLNTGIEVAVNPGEPPAPKEKTTTERLFPDFTTDDGGIVNRPVKQFEDAARPSPAAATPEVIPPQVPTKPTETPTAPSYLTLDEMKGKMVKTKVDGVEKDVPADEVFRAHQLERHLNAQLMNLAQERKAFEDERKRLISQPQEPPKPGKQETPAKKAPEMEALEAQYQALQAQMATLQQTMLPAIQESGIKRVEQMVKTQIGTDDFRQYFEKIRDSALEQMARPEVANNPNARQYFDSDGYYFEKYKEMKLKELVSKPSTPTSSNPNAPVLQTPEGAPVVLNNQGQPVSVPTFEGSGGVPSKTSPNADWQSTYNALFTRARQTGAQEDWAAFYRHKVYPRE